MEFKEDTKAALQLCSLTYVEVDEKTARDMEKQRQEAIHAELLRVRPWLPPVPSVTLLMGKCSKPISKQLEVSDVKNDQSRLALKKEYVLNKFVPMLNRSKENIADGIDVVAYDSYGNMYEEMKFIVWGSKMYVLTRQWKEFSEHYKLISIRDSVKVWMFRNKYTKRLCVVIVPIIDHTVSTADRIEIRKKINSKNKKKLNPKNK